MLSNLHIPVPNISWFWSQVSEISSAKVQHCIFRYSLLPKHGIIVRECTTPTRAGQIRIRIWILKSFRIRIRQFITYRSAFQKILTVVNDVSTTPARLTPQLSTGAPTPYGLGQMSHVGFFRRGRLQQNSETGQLQVWFLFNVPSLAFVFCTVVVKVLNPYVFRSINCLPYLFHTIFIYLAGWFSYTLRFHATGYLCRFKAFQSTLNALCLYCWRMLCKVGAAVLNKVFCTAIRGAVQCAFILHLSHILTYTITVQVVLVDEIPSPAAQRNSSAWNRDWHGEVQQVFTSIVPLPRPEVQISSKQMLCTLWLSYF